MSRRPHPAAPKVPANDTKPTGPLDPEAFAKTLLPQLAALQRQTAQINEQKQQLNMRGQQLAQAEARVNAEINDLGGQAKAIAAILGKTIADILPNAVFRDASGAPAGGEPEGRAPRKPNKKAA